MVELDAQHMTRSEAAYRLGVHPSTITRWIESGRLDGYLIGPAAGGRNRVARVRVAAIEGWEKSGGDPTLVESSPPGQELSERLGLDSAYMAALIVLNDPAFRERVATALDISEWRMDWEALRAACRSTEERVLVGVAEDFWNPTKRATHLGDLLAFLSDGALRRVLAAVEVARQWITVEQARARSSRANLSGGSGESRPTPTPRVAENR
jgi:excisionase family DNA binding protein